MRDIYLIGVLLLVFMGCSNKTPKHYYGTENFTSNQLSLISVTSNEIILLEVDGEKYLGKYDLFAGEDDVYLRPGMHKFKAQLYWEFFIGNTSVHKKSKKLIEGCIDMEAGKHYRLYARNPGSSWRFVYSIIGEKSKIIDIPKCN